MPRIGAHLPVGKGLAPMLDTAARIGVEALQMFVRNPRGMAAREITEGEAAAFRSRVRELGIHPVVVHIPYICNPASVKEDLYELAARIVREDLIRSSLLGADFLVLHPGTCAGGTREEAIERVGRLLARALQDYEGSTTLLVETMSGQGSEIGRDFTEMRAILDAGDLAGRVGVCLDTCHVLAAGYALDSEEGVRDTVRQMRDALGGDSLRLVHANDSMKPRGSHRDRHAPIGKGELGVEGFRRLMENDYLGSRAFILETPVETIADDVAVLKEIRQRSGER